MTLIIAEAGVNHNGDLALALKLVDAAASAGADLVKFQTFRADALVTATAKKADYQVRMTGSGESQQGMLRRLELSRDDHVAIIRRCRDRGIGFFSTGFDIASIDMLIELGLDRFKVPSGEITNLPYLRHIGRLSMPVIISTGMATMDEIRAAVDAVTAAGTPRSKITVLHCTTEYPTPMENVNLRAMLTIRDELEVNVGYSDHTEGIEAAVAATALGATVIEKHFTIDRSMPGPDHKASLEPDELENMVRAIRNIERALGGAMKVPSPAEKRTLEVVRKSIVASRAISKGEAFTTENIVAKHPGTGISPMRWDEVIGNQAKRDFARDEFIEL